MAATLMVLLGVVLLVFGLLVTTYALGHRRAARFYDARGHPKDDGVRLEPGTVRSLRVLPLVDWYAASPDLETEAGVSYLVRADETAMLFDLGLNRRGQREAPLRRNMRRLGVDPKRLDFAFVSHPHPDHLGGLRNWLARRAVLDPDDALAGKPVYSSVPLRLGYGSSTVLRGPRVLARGVTSTGPLPVQLFLLGYTLEHALVVKLEGKGLVLIVGCGHPGLEAIVERAEQLFGAPVYGVIGGLHFPVTDDRTRVGPLMVQRLLGTPNPPWRPIGREAVRGALAYLKRKGVRFVSVSAHDSCDWSLNAFAEVFGAGYQRLRVGEELVLEGAFEPETVGGS